MRRIIQAATAIAFTIGCSSCGNKPEERVEALIAENARLTVRIAALEKKTDSLSNDLWLLNYDKSLYEVAVITPGADGYSVLDSELARFAVAVSNIRPYANGSKVTLELGNSTSATINGITARIDYGGVDAKGIPVNAEAKSTDLRIESVAPGAWKLQQLVLEGVPPERLGFVRIRDLKHKGIALRK